MTSPSDRSAELVIELAKVVVLALREREPDWQRAYIRFEATDDWYELKGSYITSSDIHVINTLEYRNLFGELGPLGCALRNELAFGDRRFCLFLLSVDSSLQYSIDYEWEDSTRWRISKFDGATGVPDGVDPPPRSPATYAKVDASPTPSHMRVVDQERRTWFLLLDRDRYYFDARVSRSAVDWSLLIELNQQECREYREVGRSYLDWLAARINSATDEYVGRDLSENKGQAVLQAVREWRATTDAPPAGA